MAVYQGAEDKREHQPAEDWQHIKEQKTRGTSGSRGLATHQEADDQEDFKKQRTRRTSRSR